MTKPTVLNITKPISLRIIKEINSLWYADVEIEKDDYIKPESYVEFDGELYISKNIRKIKDKGKTTYKIRLEHFMIELIDLSVVAFDYESKTPTYILTQFLSGTDWSVGTVNLTTPIDLKSDRRIPILKALNLLASECEGELDFLKNRVIDLKSQIGSETKLQLRYDKNCDYIEKKEDTSQLCTRLYLYGRDNLTIESVNGGIEYLDSAYINNYKYRKEKVIYTNITDASDLKTWGEAYLAIYEIPFLTYKVGLADLTKFKIWQHEIINLGDTSRIYDADLGLNVDVRVRKITKDYVSENIYLEFVNYLYLPKFDTAPKTLAYVSEVISNITPYDDPTKVSIEAIDDLPICFVIYVGGILSVGIYQGPIIWVHTPCTAVEIYAYCKWKPTAGNVTIELFKNGISIGTVTIPQGEYVAPGEGEVGAGATTSINVSLSVFDRLNIDINEADGVGAGVIVQVRCVK